MTTSPAAPSCSTTSPMERIIRRFAGAFVLGSLLGAWLLSPWWLALTTFVGVNLLQSSFTGFCPLEMILARFGVGQQATVVHMDRS